MYKTVTARIVAYCLSSCHSCIPLNSNGNYLSVKVIAWPCRSRYLVCWRLCCTGNTEFSEQLVLHSTVQRPLTDSRHTYTRLFYFYITAPPQIYEILSILGAIQKLITVISYVRRRGGGEGCCNYLTVPRALTSIIYDIANSSLLSWLAHLDSARLHFIQKDRSTFFLILLFKSTTECVCVLQTGELRIVPGVCLVL